MTVAQYLASEQSTPVRREYVGGELYEMRGARKRHNLICQNVLRGVSLPARRRGCRAYIEGVLTQVADDVFYYPDVSVECPEPGDDEWISRAPSLVVEVTSASTRATDHREKVLNYRKLDSLQMYLIVEHNRREVTVHRRSANGEWDRLVVCEDETIEIPFLGAKLTLDEIYEDVSMPALRVREVSPGGYEFDDDPEDDDDEPWW